MSELVDLAEYESVDVPLDTERYRDLVHVAGDRVTIVPTLERGVFTITAKQYVGSIAVRGVNIVIRPKVPLTNLFAMLDVGVPTSAWSPELARYGKDRDLLPAIASFYARVLDRLLAGGILRAYRGERERLPALRGKLDFPELIRRPGLAIPIPSQYDDFTVDIEANRLLRRASSLLLRQRRLPESTRRGLTRSIGRLEGVTDAFVPVEIVDRFVFDRLTRRYEPALRLAALILRSGTLFHRHGDVAASAFLIDMNDLFQDFVHDRLRRHLRRRMDVLAEPGRYLGDGRKVQMFPDLEFQEGGRTVYVADVKYKVSSGLARNADYYQLLAYATALGLEEGALFYCRTEGEDVPPKEIAVRNSGHRLVTYRLDLTGEVADLESSLVEAAEWLSGRVDRRASPTDVLAN